MKEHGLYKFVEKDTKQIVYIGKTNSSFKQRIDAHIRAKDIDAKFKPYIDKCEVFITRLPNRTETDILERALINKYKPILNGTDNHEGIGSYIHIDEPKWEKYNDESIIQINLDTKIKVSNMDLILWTENGFAVLLSNYFDRKRKKPIVLFEDCDKAWVMIEKLILMILEIGIIEDDSYVVLVDDMYSKGFYEQLDFLEDVCKNDTMPYLKIWKGTYRSYEHIISCMSGKQETLVSVKFAKTAIDLLLGRLRYVEFIRNIRE